jgi:hypothetical protein
MSSRATRLDCELGMVTGKTSAMRFVVTLDTDWY